MRKPRTAVAMVALIVSAFSAYATRLLVADSPNQKAAKKNPMIRIIDASFGDQLSHKTCTPDLSICKGLAVCRFTVANMCAIDSQVKNLEVTWDCGDGTAKKARAAAKGTEISLECANK